MRLSHFILLILLAAFLGCANKGLDPSKPVYVTIETSMGDVTVVLYDDTPLHRDNFIKLCQSGAQDGVLFHRIIDEFVAQGGDPDSKAHEPEVRYGSNSGGYTVPAEILPHYFNKRGALIDAKKGDDVNPERASAGTQFCFVQGKIHTDEELDEREVRINDIRTNWFFHKFKARVTKDNPDMDADSLISVANRMVADTLSMAGMYFMPEERREYYKTKGGVPHLDGSVTIFGEVVEGLDVVEMMSLVETDQYDRPLEDVMVISTKVFQK